MTGSGYHRRGKYRLLNCIGAAVAAAFLGACADATKDVAVAVFYDENGNDFRDGAEVVRIPDAVVRIGHASAVTDSTGRALVEAPIGAHYLTLEEATLPPYFSSRALLLNITASGPADDFEVPVTLPIGGNEPNAYMGFGDSITSDNSYLELLDPMLREHFGAARTINEGQGATRTYQGAERIDSVIMRWHAAYVLILYGVNDWNEPACRDEFPCYTIDSLRYMVRAVKANTSLPFLATIPPVNVGYDWRTPPERNEWVARMNDLVRQLAKDEQVVLVDIHKAFLEDPDQKSLFSTHVHPSEKGRRLMTDVFFKAITKRQT